MNHENYNSFYQFYDLCMFQKLVILKIRHMIVWIFQGQIIYLNIFHKIELSICCLCVDRTGVSIFHAPTLKQL